MTSLFSYFEVQKENLVQCYYNSAFLPTPEIHVVFATGRLHKSIHLPIYYVAIRCKKKYQLTVTIHRLS